jgi:hypothetical protein
MGGPLVQDTEGLGFNRTAYEFDFFTSTQIGIYIGDVLIDDANHIEFQVIQGKQPVYGYASQYYHKVAPGQVKVSGSFTVNFKEADYIIATLARYHANIPPVSGSRRKGYKVKRETIERLLERDRNGHRPDESTYQLYRNLAAMSDEKFEDIAEDFEDLLWKQPESNFMTPNLGHIPNPDKLDISNAADNYRRGDQYLPFDIYILYGDISQAAANHTIKKLIDVEIIGQGQQITSDGIVIQERYNFIARNLA